MFVFASVFAALTLTEGSVSLNTYPFSDPDPVPATAEMRWPYFRYDGTTAKGKMKEWRTVDLENDHIRVTIIPEVGGKVWGATDKRTGRDFIYFNHSAKFRNIALCGPWASGGIEFNFGVIGHAPTTSTTVDWCVRTNADGSVSYFCSNTELINRTTWQVEVRLGKDDSFFTTHVLWHNGSNLPCPYYHWMNAAYPTRGDPELVFPGDFHIGHEGNAYPWPVDVEGRDIRFVNRNDFGGNKSYQVCGGDTRLFGVWWKEWGLGAYHRNAFGEKYGRKAWIWALSREGAIWENLLTDSDGQYMELQSGRGFNQPRKATYLTPFKHPTFAPGGTDEFSEEWGVWHDRAEFADAWNTTNAVDRARTAPVDFDWTTAYGLYLRGEQALREKDDRAADEYLRKSLAKEPCLAPALVTLAELCYRRANIREAWALAEKALRINAYDPAANYWSGMVAKDRGEGMKALERLGLAAYSPYWRAAACAEMAKIHLAQGDFRSALAAARKCRDANAKSIDGYALTVLALRGRGESSAAESLLREARNIWPLARLLVSLDGNREPTRNAWPMETEMEVAAWYLGCGLTVDAKRHFAAAKGLMGELMCAYLDRDDAALAKVAAENVRFVFAHRRECVSALDWAIKVNGGWKFRYLRAQFAAANGDDSTAKALLDSVRDADDAVFYLYRGGDADLKRAAALEDSWRVGRARMERLVEAGEWQKAKAIGEDYLRRFPGRNPLQILYAKALLGLTDYDGCLKFLEGVNILPSEFGDNATDVWQAAQRAKGIKPTCPERLGSGEPYPKKPEMRKDVRMMSYNIRHGAMNGPEMRMNHEGQIDVVARERPDFVGLQEVDVNTVRSGLLDEPAEFARGTGLVSTFAKAIDFDGGDYGVAVLSREKPLAVERISLPGEEPRVLLVCEFTNCWFGTMHLSCGNDESNRTVSVAIVREAVERLARMKPVFLCGDWNATPDSPTIRGLGAFMKVLTRTDGDTYRGAAGACCLDYIAVDRAHADAVRVAGSRIIDDSVSSDHAPVTVDLGGRLR